jgi:hypothetical protein
MCTADVEATQMSAMTSVAPAGIQQFQRPRVRIRLTRRGRVVVRLGSVLLLVVVVAAAVLLGGGRADGGEQARPLPVTYHVVAPGETLWQLASELQPGVDPRDTVARIVELNQLRSADIAAGTRLALPQID